MVQRSGLNEFGPYIIYSITQLVSTTNNIILRVKTINYYYYLLQNAVEK